MAILAHRELLAERQESHRLLSSNDTDALNYRLEAVWPEPSEAVREEVVQFWLAESAIPDLEAAQQRAHELLVVARDSNGQVAGVSTAVRSFIAQLGFECFFYRTFVGQAHRVHGLRSTKLFWEVLLESYRLLNDQFQRGCDPGVLGLYAVIENPSMMRVRRDLVWNDEGMNAVYIGRTQDGKHIRAWYFDARGFHRILLLSVRHINRLIEVYPLHSSFGE